MVVPLIYMAPSGLVATKRSKSISNPESISPIHILFFVRKYIYIWILFQIVTFCTHARFLT